VLPLRAHHRLADENIGSSERRVRSQAELDLVRDRHVERIAFDRGPMRAGSRLQLCELSRVQACRGAGEGAGAKRGLPRSLGGQPPIAGKPPRPSDQHADPDPFALGIRDTLDPSVLRRHELVTLQDGPCIRVLRTCAGRRIDRRCTHVSHLAARSPLAALA
jgi:hypothetical protein